MTDIDEAVYDDQDRRNDPTPDPTRDMPEPVDWWAEQQRAFAVIREINARLSQLLDPSDPEFWR